MARYQKFEPLKCAARSLNYITSMVDPAEGYLPYWLVLPNKKPAEAAHCRVDDAELVGSWYEGLDSVREMLGTEPMACASIIPIPGPTPCIPPSMKWAISSRR